MRDELMRDELMRDELTRDGFLGIVITRFTFFYRCRV